MPPTHHRLPVMPIEMNQYLLFPVMICITEAIFNGIELTAVC